MWELKYGKEINKIALYIIASLNNNGYLGNTLENICYELSIDENIAKKSLNILQSLEPSGIGGI